MNTFEANTTGSRRSPRLWIVETLVVLGVLAFGYFALSLDAAQFAPAPVETINPLSDFVR